MTGARLLPEPLDRALAAEAVPVRPSPAPPTLAPVTAAQAARHRAVLLAALAAPADHATSPKGTAT